MFQTSVHNVPEHDSDRLTILKELLTPNVKQTIAKFLFNPSLYSKAWETLERNYGNQDLNIEACCHWRIAFLEGLRLFRFETFPEWTRFACEHRSRHHTVGWSSRQAKPRTSLFCEGNLSKGEPHSLTDIPNGNSREGRKYNGSLRPPWSRKRCHSDRPKGGGWAGFGRRDSSSIIVTLL